MVAVYLGVAGLFVFVAGTLVLGIGLRLAPATSRAETYSRVMHLLFFLCLSTPFLVSLITPGVTRLDAVLGLPPLPWRPLSVLIALMLGSRGLYYLGGSNRSLRARGQGANAFRLTQHVVTDDVYTHTRNPMSFGYYLCCLSLGLLTGSTALTMYVAIGLIPAHTFFLKFFEERELELRLGPSYVEYRDRVPFLVPSRR